MLIVNTYLAPSSVHGMGLFAGDNIRKGDVVWRFTPRIDVIFTPRQMSKICRTLDCLNLRHLSGHVYKRNNKYFFLSDNAQFINHSEAEANIAIVDDLTEVALRDIARGEELLENYLLSYDSDDPFFFEINNVCVDNLLTLTTKEKRRLAKNQNILG